MSEEFASEEEWRQKFPVKGNEYPMIGFSLLIAAAEPGGDGEARNRVAVSALLSQHPQVQEQRHRVANFATMLEEMLAAFDRGAKIYWGIEG